MSDSSGQSPILNDLDLAGQILNTLGVHDEHGARWQFHVFYPAPLCITVQVSPELPELPDPAGDELYPATDTSVDELRELLGVEPGDSVWLAYVADGIAVLTRDGLDCLRDYDLDHRAALSRRRLLVFGPTDTGASLVDEGDLIADIETYLNGGMTN